MAEDMIRADEISVHLGGSPILNQLSFCASAGMVTAIVGPNGSGKTTLLRALTGELPHTGTIAINGHKLSNLSPFEQANLRGVLPQSSIVTFPFTVREIVRLGGKKARPDPAENTLVDQALERVGLSNFSGRRYGELSGGEQQRVQLARVLYQVGEPRSTSGARWLLLDEPVSSLDIRHQLQIMNIALEFSRSGGGVVAVMHDLNLTAMFADSVVMMANGQIGTQGDPGDVLNSANVSRIFDCDLTVNQVPRDRTPFILPHSALP